MVWRSTRTGARARPVLANTDGLANLADQGVLADLALLRSWRMNPLVVPVNIVECQAAHLAGAKAVHHQQSQHCVIADLRGGVATIGVKEPLDLAPLGTLGQPLVRV